MGHCMNACFLISLLHEDPMTSVTNNRPISSATATGEQRYSSRRGYDIQVGVASDHRLFVGLTSNISTGGLFIATDEPVKKGDNVEVRFSIPGANHVFQKTATVCWTRPFDNDGTSRTKAGCGVQFNDLSEEEARILNAFLAVHEPIFYDV